MADDQNILGGKLSIEDNYSSAFQRFANGILSAENKFKQFASSIVNSNQKIVNETSKTSQQIDKIAQKFISKCDTVADAINKANERVKENQEKTIEGLSQKYIKLGMTIQEAYAKAKQESNKIWNGNVDNKNSNSEFNMNDGFKDFAQSFLSGGFGGAIGKLGLIGTGVMATVSVLKKIDGAMDTGFDILNRLSDNMFSYEGIKESLDTAMSYQSTRAKLDLFYGSEEQGTEAYQLASKVALDTFADPQSLAEAMSIMKKNGINADEDDLYTYLDMVGSRGDGTSAKEVGLAIEDAMNGEWERLKEYSITTTKLKNYIKELKTTNKAAYKEFKNVFNNQGSVTDPQKAYNLILDYVRNSEINGYAEKYAQTAQGSIDNLTGLWEQIKVSIMGLDDAGNVIDGSALFHFSDMVNNLKDTLGSESATKGFEEISKSLGEGFEAFGEAFDHILENTDWEKVAKAITDSINVISDALINLSESGALQDLADNSPKIIKWLLNDKLIDFETDVNMAKSAAEERPFQLAADWVTGGIAWAENKLGFVDKANASMNTQQVNHGGTIELSDSEIYKYIQKSNINTNFGFGNKENNQLQDIIMNDDKPSYRITVNAGASIDEILAAIRKELEDSQLNRK